MISPAFSFFLLPFGFGYVKMTLYKPDKNRATVSQYKEEDFIMKKPDGTVFRSVYRRGQL